MKLIITKTLTIISVIFYSCNSDLKKSQVDNKENCFRELFVDLNGDNFIDTIKLLESNTSGDPGAFKKIQITGNFLNPFSLKANDAWDTLPNYLRKNNDKELKCDFLFVKRTKKTSYLILTGYPYPTGREDFAIIGISGQNCNLITKKNFNEVLEIIDSRKDKNINIVLKNNWTEEIEFIDSLNESVQSYSPYLVYTVTDNSFSIDTTLTKEYNESNYVWAGLENKSNVRVLQTRDDNKYRIYTK